jgi:hypothetical protein
MSDERPVEDELEPTDGENTELDGDKGLGEAEARASEPVAARSMRQVRGPEPRATTGAPARAVAPEDELPYIDDRLSKIWVGAIVAVFALILAYGLLFGKAGALTPATPSPTPSPSATPTLSASPVPSLTAAPSVTITPLPSVTATPCPSPGSSANPSPGC